MQDIFEEILETQTAPGQLFETKDVVNEAGITSVSYTHLTLPTKA